MPIPFIVPIAAAAAAGTVGFLVGREMASSPKNFSVSDLGGHAGLPGMTEAEALKILELEAGATPDEIREAHDRLAHRLRSDRGGSDYLVDLVGRAKAVLLNGAAESEN